MTRLWVVRVGSAHPRTLVAMVCGVVAFLVLGRAGWPARAVLAWDVFALATVVQCTLLALASGREAMAANASRQQDGEWTVFWVVILGVMASFVAVLSEFSGLKEAAPAMRDLRIGLVVATLVLSWVVTHVVFALRYAHEYYETAPDGVRGGLEFPGKAAPDYWDFLYFSMVIGMTFQVSDVQITDRMLRRLALVQGVLSFLFNTVIVALTVNLAAGLL